MTAGGRDSSLCVLQTTDESLQRSLDAPAWETHANKYLIHPIAIFTSFASILGKQMEIQCTKGGGGKREKSLTLQIFLKWYLRELQVRSIKPPVPSSLLFDKKTLSQAEQKINEPTSSD